MKPLRDRNQALVGTVTLVVIVLAIATSYYSNDLPMFDNGTTYSANFAESAGLEPDDEVQIAGVKVGEVSDVSLDGKQINVRFKVDGKRLGDETTSSIEIKTLLGDKYLALQPQGDNPQDPNNSIPLERTRTPFQLQDAFKQLSSTVDELDTDQLAQSFTVISNTLKDTPGPMRDALNGLSSLSTTVSSRDKELSNLLGNTSDVSKTLSDRNTQVQRVIDDGNLLLDELQQRKDAISQLLNGARSLSEQLSGVVADNKEQLRPALERLDTVTGVLQRNQDNLDRSLKSLAPFTRVGANATANGRWFEGYLCGLLPPAISAGGLQVNPEGCTPPISAPNQGVGPR